MTKPKVALIAATLFAGGMVVGAPAAMARSATPMGRDDVRASAACVVEQNRRLVAELFTTLPGSADEHHVVSRLNAVFGACFDGEQRITGDDVAGLREALAVALVASDRPRMARVGEPWYRIATEGKARYRDYDPRRIGPMEFGSCVLAAAPEATVALVRADPDSAAEREAVASLRPVVAPCVPKDMTVHLKADDLRSLLAEPVYHATTS